MRAGVAKTDGYEGEREGRREIRRKGRRERKRRRQVGREGGKEGGRGDSCHKYVYIVFGQGSLVPQAWYIESVGVPVLAKVQNMIILVITQKKVVGTLVKNTGKTTGCLCQRD